MNIHALPQPRTLSLVLLERRHAVAERDAADRMAMQSPEGSVAEQVASDRAAAADDRIHALAGEAKELIRDATGVSWELIQEANL